MLAFVTACGRGAINSLTKSEDNKVCCFVEVSLPK